AAAERLVAEAAPAQPRRARAGVGPRPARRHRRAVRGSLVRRLLRRSPRGGCVPLLDRPARSPDLRHLTRTGGATMTAPAYLRRLVVTKRISVYLIRPCEKTRTVDNFDG